MKRANIYWLDNLYFVPRVSAQHTKQQQFNDKNKRWKMLLDSERFDDYE